LIENIKLHTFRIGPALSLQQSWKIRPKRLFKQPTLSVDRYLSMTSHPYSNVLVTCHPPSVYVAYVVVVSVPMW